jgi:hypothetical protein
MQINRRKNKPAKGRGKKRSLINLVTSILINMNSHYSLLKYYPLDMESNIRDKILLFGFFDNIGTILKINYSFNVDYN